MDKRGFLKKVNELNSQVESNRFREKESRMEDVSEIILRITGYEDIFSDFDPRHYSKRALSDDFLSELRRVSLDKEEKIELRLMTRGNPDKNLEHTVRKRLRDHFSRHLSLATKDLSAIKARGVSMTLFGAFLLTLASYVGFAFNLEGFFSHFIITLMEPAGWFTAWEGMYLIIFGASEKKKEFDFYRKMESSNIVFDHY